MPLKLGAARNREMRPAKRQQQQKEGRSIHARILQLRARLLN
jgi:hypothetical protein